MIPSPMPIIVAAAPIPTGDMMGGSWTTLLLYIGFALVASFVCSLLEASLLSSSRSYIEAKAQEGVASAQVMLQHKLNVERPISAILTLNTIAHTVGAAGAGAEAAGIFGSQYVGVISAILTLLILVLTEIVPKTLGATYWRALMPFTAYTVRALVFVLYPFVWIFQQLGERLRPEHEEPTVTRGELTTLASIGEQEGTLRARESRMLRNLLQLEHIHVSDIMTPRTVVFALPEAMTAGEVLAKHHTLSFSRIPVYGEDIDDVTGYVLRHDILTANADDQPNTPLSALRKEISVVTETLTLAQALERFVAERQHIFLVIDEYGGTAGILTMEDAIETLLGIEITDESDAVEDLRALALQRVKQLNRQRLAAELAT